MTKVINDRGVKSKLPQHGEAYKNLERKAILDKSTGQRSLTNAHLVRLDTVRGIAILIVFIFHFIGSLYGWNYYEWNGPWRSFDLPYKPYSYALYPLTLGWSGVSLFFVLSGFVIHLSYLNSNTFNLRSFYWRRFWRIYPAYLFALLFFVRYSQLNLSTDAGVIQLLSHALLVHNFHSSTFFGINASFWSLATEFQFYLLYPVVLQLRSRMGIEKALLSILLLSVSSRLALLCFTDCSYPVTALWTMPVIVWFDWVLGAYVAERFHAGRRAFNFSSSGIAAIGILFVLSTLFKPSNAFSFSIASFFSAVAIDNYVNRKNPLNRFELSLVPIGLCSYSLYLWHQPLLYPVLNRVQGIFSPGAAFPDKSFWGLATGLLGVFIIISCWSWLLYVTLERWSMGFARAKFVKASK